MNHHPLTQSDESIIVDLAAEAEHILAATEGTIAKAILLTHAYYNHIQALDALRQATGAPCPCHRIPNRR